jgi:hypothetical protein
MSDEAAYLPKGAPVIDLAVPIRQGVVTEVFALQCGSGFFVASHREVCWSDGVREILPYRVLGPAHTEGPAHLQDRARAEELSYLRGLGANGAAELLRRAQSACLAWSSEGTDAHAFTGPAPDALGFLKDFLLELGARHPGLFKQPRLG